MFDTFKTRSMIREHDDRLTTVERQLKSMQVEWTDTLDRLRTMLMRIRKERERIEAASPEELADESAGETLPTTLTERQRQINAEILSRRNRLGREQ